MSTLKGPLLIKANIDRSSYNPHIPQILYLLKGDYRSLKVRHNIF